MARRASARGWMVTLAGLGINLALGVLYSWSIIGKALTAEWGWSAGQTSLPYATAVGVFAIAMVFAGRAQDRFGPRIVATLGGAWLLLPPSLALAASLADEAAAALFNRASFYPALVLAVLVVHLLVR